MNHTPKATRILFVEDISTDMELAEYELIKGEIAFTSMRVETLEELRENLPVFAPDLIITDYVLPMLNGMQVINEIQKSTVNLPVIVLTGSINEETAVNCMKAGAWDYILKDKMLRLPFAVREALRRKESQQSTINTQKALEQSEKRFKEISEVTNEFIWEVDSNGLYTYANVICERICGYKVDELVGKKHFYDMFVPEEKDFLMKAAFEVFRSKELFKSFENKIVHKSGSLLTIETSGIPILDTKGELLGYRGVDKDVTKRKLLEDNLKQTNEKLEKLVELRTREIVNLSGLNNQIIENLGLAMVTTGLDGKLLSINLEGRRMLELPIDDKLENQYLIARTIKSEDHADSVKIISVDYEKPLQNSFGALIDLQNNVQSYSGELECMTISGKQIPIQLIINRLEDDSGMPARFVGVAIDITERKQMIEVLRQSEIMFRTMFREHGAVMFLVNPKSGIIEEANLSAEKYYGYDFNSLEKIHISTINPMSWEEMEVELQRASLKQSNAFIFTHRLANGEFRKVEVHSTPIQVKGQQLLFSIIHDITERLRTEELLKISEAENRAIISTVPDMLFKINKQGVYVEYYAGKNSSLFVPKEDFIGKTIKDTLPEDLAEISLNVVNQAIQTGEIVNYEYQLPISGVTRYFENRVVAINNTEVLSIIRDITDRKVNELNLRWNESLLRMMTSSSPLAFFVVDNRTDDILYFNHRFCEIWGITHLEDRMKRKELKNNEIIPDCIPVLEDVAAFAESCKPLQFEENRIVLEDIIPFNDGRSIRRFSSQIRGEKDEYFGRFYIFEDVTAHAKAEQEIALRESYLSSVINNHPGMFWLKDTDGRFIFINDRNDNFMKNANLLEVEVVIGKTDFEFMAKDKAAIYALEDKQVMEERTPISVEESLIIDGIESWFEKFKYPILNNEGKVIGVSGYSIDITDRKKTEFQLKMQNAAFESFSLAMMITNLDGVIQWVNPAFCNLTGYNFDEIIGQKPSIVKSEFYSQEFYQSLWEHLLTGKVWTGELMNKRKDGTLYFEEETITPVFDECGVISRFIALKIDITHRKEMEEALRLSEERWQFALEGLGDGVWDWNIITNNVFFSPQWKAMLGYGIEEITNDLAEWELRVHPNDLQRCTEDIQAHFNKLTTLYINEHRMLCKDGSYKWILDRGKVVEWTTDSKPVRMIGTHSDITQSKLLQEKLMHAIEKEKDLNDMKTRFVATASHEFRTPLASILIITDTLLEYWKRLAENQISERLFKIKEQTIHLSNVVNNVLQLSKIQQGKLAFDPLPNDLVSLIRVTIDSFSSDPMAVERIHFQSEVSEIWMNLDRGLMTQVMNNLISNALKYSPWNSTIEISLKKLKNFITVHVKDHGIGIPQEEQKHLFKPFFRASNTRMIQGNGLGLNIVRESVRMHNGDITFESNEGNGTLFTITLPDI
jgi:PAS domain S-box-containing protein